MKIPPEIELVPVSSDPEVLDVLWRLLQEQTPDQSISHKHMPSMQAHKHFVTSYPYRFWWLIRDGHGYVGSLYATYHNEVGVRIFSQHQRKGYARAALTQLFLSFKPLSALPGRRSGRWLANINPDNLPSIKLFESLGMRRIQQTHAKD